MEHNGQNSRALLQSIGGNFKSIMGTSLSLMEDDSDEVNDTWGNETGSKDKATNGNKHGDEYNERFDTQVNLMHIAI